MGRPAGQVQGRLGRRAAGPDGEHLEPVPVHGHVQPGPQREPTSRAGSGGGSGFRDTNQDLLGCVHQVPRSARQRLLDVASTQFEDGGAWHQYQPLTKQGNAEVGGDFNDDPLWLILAIAGVSQGDGRLAVPGGAGAVRQRSLQGRAAVRAPEAVLPPRGGQPGSPRAAADRPGGLERLPEPQLLLDGSDESFQTTGTRDGTTAESVLIAGMFVFIGADYVEICRRTRQDGGGARRGSGRRRHERQDRRAGLGRRVVSARL